MPELGYEHTERLLIRLGDLSAQVILVGGQAVNFWAYWYDDTDAAGVLRDCEPFTSKDIDIAATPKQVETLAKRIGGTARVAGFDDGSAHSGVVTYKDDDGTKRTLDVMGMLIGVDNDELKKTSIPIAYTLAKGVELRFSVMHPVLMLESRVCNVLGFEKYRTAHGLRQLRAAVICARQYLLQMAPDDPDRVLTWNERIFKFRRSRSGKRIAAEHGVDVFEAIALASNLDAKFLTIRYPQMKEQVERLRAKRA